MARRKDHSGEELIALTLDAAEKIVDDEGLAGLSARRVAKEIGYTVGTLYNHFEDLDEIVLRVNARGLQRLRERLAAVMGSHLQGRDRIHAMADAYLAFAIEEPHRWRTLTGFQRSKAGAPPEWYLAEANQLIDLLADLMEPVLPDLQGAERAYRARRLWASIHGVCALAAAGSIGRALVDPVDRMVHDLVDLQCAEWARE